MKTKFRENKHSALSHTHQILSGPFNTASFKLALSLLLSTVLAFSAINASATNKRPLIPSPPQVAASSYILIDANSGEVLVEHNAHEPLPPASLTKMMTSYVAAHEIAAGNVDLSDQVRISIKAWKKGGSKMYIREGTMVNLEDLLRGVVIQSGNDASIAVAEHIAGSEDAFADLMNQHATNLGLTNTYFVNATGWPADNHLSTASDLAFMARAIIVDYPEHYEMYAEKEFTYNKITQSNRNLLLWRDSTVDGVKTGHTEEAGYCLVSSAEKNGMRLIAAVLGTKSREARASESQKLLTYGFRFFETHHTYGAGETLNEAQIWMGAEDIAPLGLTEDLIITIPRGQKENLKAEVSVFEQIKAPIDMGTTYGVLKLKLGSEVVAEKPLVALENVEEAGLIKRLWHWLYLLVIGLF